MNLEEADRGLLEVVTSILPLNIFVKPLNKPFIEPYDSSKIKSRPIHNASLENYNYFNLLRINF